MRHTDTFDIPATVCIVVIAVAMGLLLHESLIGGKGLVPSDAVVQYQPWVRPGGPKPSNYLLMDQYLEFVPGRQFVHDEFQQGRFPLWNPRLASGVPSLASMQGAVLYPINLLLTPLSPFRASGLAAFAKLLIAGLFTLLFLRRIGVTNVAALVGALTFSLSGFLIVWLGHPHTNCAVLLPALFYFVEGLVTGSRRRREWAGLALTFGMVFLGGHPPTIVHVTLAVLAFAAFRMMVARTAGRWRAGLSLPVAILAGALIAGPQLLPFAEYYPNSSIPASAESTDRTRNHLQRNTLVHFLMPYVTGSPATGFEELVDTFRLRPLANFNERTGYVGLLALFLSLVALIRRRCAFTVFFALMAFVSLTIIYGIAPWPAILRNLPVLSSIDHQRLLLLVDFSGAVLAGLGVDTLMRLEPKERPRWIALTFVGIVSGALWVMWQRLGGVSHLDAATRSFLVGQVAIVAGGLITIIVISRRWLSPRWLMAVCVGWTAVDLLWFATGYNPAIAREAYAPSTPAIRLLQDDRTQFRLFGLGKVFAPNLPSMYGLDDLRGQDFATVRRYEELITGRAGNFLFYMTGDGFPPDVALRTAKYVIAPNREASVPPGLELIYDAEVAIYRNTRFIDRAIAVFDHRVESDPARLLAAVRDPAFDPARTIWLEEPAAEPPANAGPADTPSSANVRITRYEPDHVALEAQMPRSGFVVLMDTYFPGWTATIDGHPVPIYRADYDYRAVQASGGTHTITFEYRPWSFRWGLMASLVGLTLIAVVWRR